MLCSPSLQYRVLPFLPTSRRLLLLLCCSCLALNSVQDVRADELSQLEQQARAAHQQRLDHQTQLNTTETELKTATAKLTDLERAKQRLTPQRDAQQKQWETEQSELKKLADDLEAARKQEQSVKENEESTKEDQQKAMQSREAAEKAINEKRTASEATAAKLKEQQTQLAELAKQIGTQREQIGQLQSQLAELQSRQAALVKAETEQWERVAAGHRSAGSFVSFGSEIAPILYQRCLACHNEGKPRGQFQVDNFARLMRGGESGDLLDLADPELSTLLAMIEDGSMPQDDDPLQPEQIELFRRWIQQGAQFDGVVENTAPLIEVIPRPTYPSPPEVYPQAVAVSALAWHADGSRLASSGYHEVLVWSLDSGELLQRIQNLPERIYALTFLSDSDLLAVAGGTPGEVGEVKIINSVTGERIIDLHIASEIILSVALSPDGNRLALGGADGLVHLYDTQTWRRTLTIHEHGDWITSLAWSPDSTRLVTACRDKTCKVFVAESGENLMTFNGHTGVVSAITFLGDGEQLASGGEDRRLRIWKVVDASEVRNVAGYGGDITRIGLLPDGRLITTATDQRIRVHAAADTKLETTLTGPSSPLLSLSVASTGNSFISGGLNGEIQKWRIGEEKPTQTWFAQPSSK